MGRNILSVPRVFDFQKQLIISTGTSANQTIGELMLSVIPGSTRAIQSNKNNDKSGIDWWLEMDSGSFLGVDCKIREIDFGRDDLALETWSVVEKKRIGWTLDSTKRTDYVFWVWKDSGRWCVVPFRLLLKASLKNLDKWKAVYKTARQCTENKYHSECIFVPRREVWKQIYLLSEGNSEALKVQQLNQGTLFGAIG